MQSYQANTHTSINLELLSEAPCYYDNKDNREADIYELFLCARHELSAIYITTLDPLNNSVHYISIFSFYN